MKPRTVTGWRAPEIEHTLDRAARVERDVNFTAQTVIGRIIVRGHLERQRLNNDRHAKRKE